MMRNSILTATIAILSAGSAGAQVQDIRTGLPGSGYGYFTLSPTYEGPMTAENLRHNEIERKYRETVRTIPDRKPSNDPWRNVRPAAAAQPIDRHRVE